MNIRMFEIMFDLNIKDLKVLLNGMLDTLVEPRAIDLYDHLLNRIDYKSKIYMEHNTELENIPSYQKFDSIKHIWVQHNNNALDMLKRYREDIEKLKQKRLEELENE